MRSASAAIGPARAGLRRIDEFLAQPVGVSDQPRAAVPAHFSSAIEFLDVRLVREGRVLLDRINLTIRRGSFVGIVGGWITDRIGIFPSLWILGLAQAVSNLGYWIAAGIIPLSGPGVAIPVEHMIVLYAASATESFTGGLGTAAFLAFLMAIVEKERAATEYALLSSVFALSRSVAGWIGGLGAQSMGYGNWFLLTFFLAAPAYLLLPWVRRMLNRSNAP